MPGYFNVLYPVAIKREVRIFGSAAIFLDDMPYQAKDFNDLRLCAISTNYVLDVVV